MHHCQINLHTQGKTSIDKQQEIVVLLYTSFFHSLSPSSLIPCTHNDFCKLKCLYLFARLFTRNILRLVTEKNPIHWEVNTLNNTNWATQPIPKWDAQLNKVFPHTKFIADNTESQRAMFLSWSTKIQYFMIGSLSLQTVHTRFNWDIN